MKIAVTAQGPGEKARVDPRFGRAKFFVVYDSDGGQYQTIDNKQVLNLPQGAGIQAAQHIIDAGAEVLLTGHCGPNAYQTLQAGGVKVVTDVEGVVAEAIARYREGKLDHAAGPDVEGHW
ncbi:MAG: dinitrogenase iron-molybdenum cofactor biosynthesis protein [Deltaproteobacteria bacterium]|nr:MAG: dinitrogenase iron-molybdenum cofactor biosynthesis protein [Deltaproteobacteria bacterium]